MPKKGEAAFLITMEHKPTGRKVKVRRFDDDRVLPVEGFDDAFTWTDHAKAAKAATKAAKSDFKIVGLVELQIIG